jgi:hypothetical protein
VAISKIAVIVEQLSVCPRAQHTLTKQDDVSLNNMCVKGGFHDSSQKDISRIMIYN